MRVSGTNAIFRDPMAALVAGGQIVAAAGEHLSWPTHHQPAVPFPVSEPEPATRRDFAGSDAVPHWYHDAPTHPAGEFRLGDRSDSPRRPHVRRAPSSWPRPHLCATSPTMRSFAAAATLVRRSGTVARGAALGRCTC